MFLLLLSRTYTEPEPFLLLIQLCWQGVGVHGRPGRGTGQVTLSDQRRLEGRRRKGGRLEWWSLDLISPSHYYMWWGLSFLTAVFPCSIIRLNILSFLFPSARTSKNSWRSLTASPTWAWQCTELGGHCCWMSWIYRNSSWDHLRWTTWFLITLALGKMHYFRTRVARNCLEIPKNHTWVPNCCSAAIYPQTASDVLC